MKLLIINGPNLNLIGRREVDVYGKENLEQIINWVSENIETSKVDLIWFQSNSEGEIIDKLHWAIDNQIRGLYHITNNERISKYELLNLFKKYTKKNISIKRVPGKKTDKSFIDTRMLLNYKIPSYDMMVESPKAECVSS